MSKILKRLEKRQDSTNTYPVLRQCKRCGKDMWCSPYQTLKRFCSGSCQWVIPKKT